MLDLLYHHLALMDCSCPVLEPETITCDLPDQSLSNVSLNDDTWLFRQGRRKVLLG